MSLWYIPRGTCEKKIKTDPPGWNMYMKEMEGGLFVQEGEEHYGVILGSYCWPKEFLIRVASTMVTS